MANETGTLAALQELVVARLRREIAAAGRGGQQRIIEGAGIKSPTLSNILDGSRRPGLETIHKLADYWGTTYGDLEREVSGTRPHQIVGGRDLSDRPRFKIVHERIMKRFREHALALDADFDWERVLFMVAALRLPDDYEPSDRALRGILERLRMAEKDCERDAEDDAASTTPKASLSEVVSMPVPKKSPRKRRAR